ncbi:bifunctional diaminohydroxyphosphoribosylaminopyrimidine deaminase/5-amino-6-(5-phosphoribosylamino)uracil reductase RibD [Coraliomargarita parva]|uniref:bifunctional diaminohydroxyphosphoribosylaminopyrimidine deaminase/5-amino-6-(5-phosphoribosylamino)uracil reductase RibD n=1 Tax=Coraliomargarita parva TaxID=3014050 RepID=UPI0022B3FD7A|nr:bifunctional diaminohydroxyphosphoribosylaminopyrimidine deaminase/5-amino-6-(5-phosphoribosylamino)uracil reductase RibD [Coraliomargarita parva]
MTDSPHETYMARALALAQRAWGCTHPNPMVGAVIVEAGEIVAEGWHHAAGQPHAEIEALRALGRRPGPDATIYVTLEPCSTHGRTGACTRAILDAGIRRVVVGAVDPNPAHAGAGLQVLRDAGVEVIEGILSGACRDLNLIFNHWIVHQSPLCAVKLAMTLDGKFAASSGHSRWVTGPEARGDVMRWRRYFPAIAVGAQTVLADDPSLTSRIEGLDTWCPVRFVFDRSLKTVEAERVPALYSDAYKARTCVLCSVDADPARKAQLSSLGIRHWELPEADGHLDWTAFKTRCTEEGICGVYVEAGPALASELIAAKSVDYAYIYKAPKFMLDSDAVGMGRARATQRMEEAFELHEIHHAGFGSDSLIRGYLG